MMLTKRTLFYIRKSIQHGQYCCLHPFIWNKATNLPELTTSVRRLRVWYMNVAFTFCYYFYVLGKCIYLNMSDTAEVQEKVFMAIVAIFFLLPLAFEITFLTNNESFPGVVQLFLRCSNGQTERFEGSKIMKLCEIAVTNCFYSFWSHVISFMMGWIITSPKILAPLYIGSNTPTPLVKFVSILLFGYFGYSFNANSVLMVCTGFPWLCSGMYLLQKLRYDCDNGLKHPAKALRTYREIHMLITYADKVYRITICVVKFMLTVFASTCAYGAMRLEGVIAPVLALMGSTDTTVLLVLLNSIGSIDDESSSVLGMFAKLPEKNESHIMRKWLRMNVRSLRPVKMHIMSFYSIQKVCVPIVLRIISENVIFMLVNY